MQRDKVSSGWGGDETGRWRLVCSRCARRAHLVQSALEDRSVGLQTGPVELDPSELGGDGEPIRVLQTSIRVSVLFPQLNQLGSNTDNSRLQLRFGLQLFGQSLKI